MREEEEERERGRKGERSLWGGCFCKLLDQEKERNGTKKRNFKRKRGLKREGKERGGKTTKRCHYKVR